MLAPSIAFSAETEPGGWAEFASFRYEGRDPRRETVTVGDGEYYNPVLAGFYPDPSVCRAGDNYYLVNSTFAYFPGVPIFKSANLVDWEQIGHVLDRPSQLDLDGLPVSSGVFAPTITFHEGVFYMITTNVRGVGNFYVTATDPAGPWSDPHRLSFDGIDPSFFFDSDGRTYIVHNGPPPGNQPLYEGHRAIWIWDFEPATRTVENGRIIVNGGVDLAEKPVWIEGPHIFRRDGWYYLSCAEGGTGPNHSQVVFRTRSLDEPFLPSPHNPILTQRDLDPDRPFPVTALGHADLVETPDGDWWSVFLGIRPYENGLSNLGRETFLLPVEWRDGWPTILAPGQPLPMVVDRGGTPSTPDIEPTTGSFSWSDEFDAEELGLPWVFLRTPRERWWSLVDKPGSLLLKPRPISIASQPDRSLERNGNPSFVGRRLQHEDFSATTRLMANPNSADSDAGVAALQNDANYFFLGVRLSGGAALEVFLEQSSQHSDGPVIVARAPLDGVNGPIDLRIEGAGRDYRFRYRLDDGEWNTLADGVDGGLLSTQQAGGFVGTVLGLYARTP
ncbi:glycoside hydrolase family 43 protein [Pseudobythopirellula maris]|nr:glycoside hydrolase family 43 protein [Pseudobythopirellula maris]